MNYYKKHLGDFAKKTAHLSTLEIGVYNLIIDGYYDREQGPTFVEAARWARARTEGEKSAVVAVLEEFFKLGDDGRYTQNRIEDELAAYHVQAEVNRGIAVAREQKKRDRINNETSTNRAPTVEESYQDREPSHKPLATSHKPLKESPIPPNGGLPSQKKSRAISFPEYIAQCKETGVLPIPDDCAVFEYAEKSKISRDFLRLQWLEFKDRYSEPDAKKYKAWPSVFSKSVRGNWFKLWYKNNDDSFVLSTTGVQAQNAHRGIE